MSDEPRSNEGTKGHEAPETRGHEPPSEPVQAGHGSPSLELGHPSPSDGLLMQTIGEMHSPAEAAPRPTAPPPKPSDAAQSVAPPQAQSAPSGDGGQND
jgi:hypothetical protein